MIQYLDEKKISLNTSKKSITSMAEEGLYYIGRPFGLIFNETIERLGKKTKFDLYLLRDVSPWLKGKARENVVKKSVRRTRD